MDEHKEIAIKLLESAMALNRHWYKYDSVGLAIEVLGVQQQNVFNAVLDLMNFPKEGSSFDIDGETGEICRDYLCDYFDVMSMREGVAAEKIYNDLIEIKKEEERYGMDFDIKPWLE